MKLQLSLLAFFLFVLSGCYTQLTSTGNERTPDFTKVERKLDNNTTQTDYYDNRMYSYYFRYFGRYDAFNHYDPFYSYNYNDYYSPYYPYYSGFYYGNDYLTYRMDLWYWNRFGYWGYNHSNYWGHGNSYYAYNNNYNNSTSDPSQRVRQGRNAVDPSLTSNTYYLPSVGSSQSNGLSGGQNNNSFQSYERSGRSSVDFGPVIMTGSSTQGATSITTTHSGSSNTTSSDTSVRASRSSTETSVAPNQTHQTQSQPTAQPSKSRSDSGSSSGRQRQGRGGR